MQKSSTAEECDCGLVEASDEDMIWSLQGCLAYDDTRVQAKFVRTSPDGRSFMGNDPFRFYTVYCTRLKRPRLSLLSYAMPRFDFAALYGRRSLDMRHPSCRHRGCGLDHSHNRTQSADVNVCGGPYLFPTYWRLLPSLSNARAH
jgi:hypothetical protein